MEAYVSDARLTDIIEEAERFKRALKPEAYDKLIDEEKVSIARELQQRRMAALR